MHDLIVYQGEAIVPTASEDPSQIDARFLAMWLHGKSEKTIRAYTADIKRLYQHTGKSLQQLTLEDFQSFINNLVHLKPRSRAQMIAAVKSALSFGLKTGYLVVNVGAVVKLPKIEDTLAERIMSEQQVARMLALEMNTRNHAILALLYRGGLRVSELCNLQWRHLTERSESGQIAVFGKGRKTRFIILDTSTWQEVLSLKSTNDTPDAYVFQSRQQHSRTDKVGDGNRLDESMIHRIVKNAAKRAGITGNVSPHWMRHAHATHALERGAPITLVKETLGHKSIETTAKYTHVRPNASSAQFLAV